MTADAAHVAAVAEALAEAKNADPAPALYVEIVGHHYGWPYYDAYFSDDAARFYATVAVETLTPLIRAQVAAKIRAGANYCPEECLTCVRCVRVGALEDAARIAESTS